MEAAHLPLGSSSRSRVGFLLVLACAVAIGLLLQELLAARLDEIRALADSDMLRARAELASLLRGVGLAVFGATGALGVSMAAACRSALAVGIFPPPGIWSWGARRVTTGPSALRLARIGLFAAVAIVLCSVLGLAAMWYAADILLACRRT